MNLSFFIQKIIILICLIAVQPASGQQIIPLWPDVLPNSKGLEDQEFEENQRIRFIKHPTLTAFFPNQESNTGVAVIICPGGGYRHLAIHKEGYQTAKWLNTKGINAFVLKYRTPSESEDLQIPYKAPLQDAQRAIQIIRKRASEWSINPDKIGIMGFSAGGHLAATASVHYEEDWGNIVDAWSAVSSKPDFSVLLYPVISTDEEIVSKGSIQNLLRNNDTPDLREFFSLEKHITEKTPPALLIHASDDEAVNPANSIRYYLNMIEKGNEAALHIFSTGGHGFGLGDHTANAWMWPELCLRWIEEVGIIE